MDQNPDTQLTELPAARSRRAPFAIAAGTMMVLCFGCALYYVRTSTPPAVPLSELPQPVTVVRAREAQFQQTRRHVGTLEAWTEAKVGPQFVSAYLETVLVRPGSLVKKGDILATLDCRNVAATHQAMSMNAAALEASQRAIASEASRISSMLDGGFVSANEVEQKLAMSANQDAQLSAARARLTGSMLEVSDCVLRAPFDGEVAVRNLDPGAFVRPGNPVATVVDTHLLRLTAEVPEIEFDSVAPGEPVKFRSLASGKEYAGVIARRSPLADPDTRTIHFEADVEDPKHELPVGSTAEIEISVGKPVPAVSLPAVAASIRGSKATVFEIAQDVAHQKTFDVLGESNGQLYLDPALGAGSQVVTEGRALLKEGARVAMAEEKSP